MKALLILAVVCVVATLAIDARSQFDEYIVKYNRAYKNDPVEYELRFKNFQNSLKKIVKLQKISPLAKFGLNKFSDMSEEEFRSRLSPKMPAAVLAQSCLANGVQAPRYDASAIPTSYDWRTKGVVNPVKNQEQCGSCWAFSTISVIESQWAIKGHNLTSFSEQLLVDCSTGCSNEEGQQVCNQGCNGGWQWNAFEDIMSWGGVETEAEYPYVGEDQTCQRNPKLTVAPIKNFTCLSGPNAADEDQMAAYLVANGPIAIAMDATILETYTSGIIDPWFTSECDPTQLDHALVIVGYGVESGWFGNLNYWIIRNSWGEDWGEQGYFRIARGYGTCGLNNAVSAVIM